MNNRAKLINKPPLEKDTKDKYTFINEVRCEDCNFPISNYKIDTPGGQMIHSSNLCLCDYKEDSHRLVWQDRWPWFTLKEHLRKDAPEDQISFFH